SDPSPISSPNTHRLPRYVPTASLSHFFCRLPRQPPRSTLFPYTTLFRSLKHLDYTYQEGEGGIAAALSLAEYFVDRDLVCVMLGDNIYEKSVRQSTIDFSQRAHGAKIHLKKVENPQRFGVPIINGDQIAKIEEKPEHPQSEYAVTGLYMYDRTVFDIIKTLKPSGRGELEITDVNNAYIDRNDMTYTVTDGWWSDARLFVS